MSDAAVVEVQPARQLDPECPWPGLGAFNEAGQSYFHGRDDEASALFRRVVEAPLTVLFGRSGLGKTSLLKAGLFPRLRQRHFLPVYVRLNIRPDAPPLTEQLAVTLESATRRERVEAPSRLSDETLWEYLHRADLELWSEKNHPLVPVLVLDQFEEVFTLGERMPEAIKTFALDFGDLVENRIPPSLAARPGAADGMDRLELRRMSYKVVLSVREDFLPELEGWRRIVPSLGRVRERLLPMNRKQAIAAVHETAPHLLDRALAERIVDFVAAEQSSIGGPPTAGSMAEPGEEQGEIEPALLSLFCSGLNQRRKCAVPPKARLDEDLLNDSKQGIIGDYYRSCVQDMPDVVSRFIESELITERGFRDSCAKEAAVPQFLSEEQLSTLIARRLLRIDERQGRHRLRIELIHDLLTRTVREHRDKRRADDERQTMAQEAAAERAALAEQARRREAQLEDERRAERERFRQREVKRLKWSFAILAVLLAFAVSMAIIAQQQRGKAVRQAKEAKRQADEAKAAVEKMQEANRAKQKAQNTIKDQMRRIDDGSAMINDLGLALLGVQDPKQEKPASRRRTEWIQTALTAKAPKAAISFTVDSKEIRKRLASGKQLYRFTIHPDRNTLPSGPDAVDAITYMADHPSFNRRMLVGRAEKGYAASYVGWGCLSKIVALIAYADPHRQPERTTFDGCPPHWRGD